MPYSSLVDRSGVVKYAVISASSTDNTIVAAVTGKKIRVLSYALVCTAAGGVRFESGTGGTALTGVMPFPANGGISCPFNEGGWFETAAGELLNLEQGATSVFGHLSYVEV